jgi:hypothetical protein
MEFKIGDRVVCVNDSSSDGALVKGRTYEVEHVRSVKCVEDGGLRLKHVAVYFWSANRFTLAAPATADTALRFNGHKPESDYILTYEGGIRAAFGYTFHYVDTLQALSRLYRDQAGPNEVLDALRRETHVRGESIVHLIADTCTRGSKKYAQGNYLKGSNWRQYFQAAMRHAERIQAGKEHDAEGFSHRGNFVWNVLMACHCISTGLGTDDRIRPEGA